MNFVLQKDGYEPINLDRVRRIHKCLANKDVPAIAFEYDAHDCDHFKYGTDEERDKDYARIMQKSMPQDSTGRWMNMVLEEMSKLENSVHTNTNNITEILKLTNPNL